MGSRPLQSLQTHQSASRVNPEQSCAFLVKPSTPAGKIPGTNIIKRRPLVFHDENVESLCLQYDVKVAMTFSTLKNLFAHVAGEQPFSLPFEVRPAEEILTGARKNLLLLGKKLPDRFDLDRNITERYYKRQIRTIAQFGQVSSFDESKEWFQILKFKTFRKFLSGINSFFL